MQKAAGFDLKLGRSGTHSIQFGLLNEQRTDRSYGARPLRRALQRHIEDPLSEALIQGQLAGASLIEIFLNDNKLGIRPLPLLDEELPSVVGPLDTNEVLVH